MAVGDVDANGADDDDDDEYGGGGNGPMDSGLYSGPAAGAAAAAGMLTRLRTQ